MPEASVVAVGASEFVSRNQLIKCDLPTMKNGEMSPKALLKGANTLGDELKCLS